MHALLTTYIQLYITISFAVQTAVVIGLRQSYYSTAEGQGPVEVCVEVLAGDISGNSYIISYSTRGGLAEGKLCNYNCMTCMQMYYSNASI